MKDKIKNIFKESVKANESFIVDNAEIVERAALAIAGAFKSGHKLLLAGNGGSAGDAQHISGEFLNRFLKERPPLPGIALTTDSSTITAIGNDYSFDEIFSKQVKALGNEGDIFFGISTSGGSKNIILAVEEARAKGMMTIGLLGRDGGVLRELVDLAIIVPVRHTPRIQEVHIIIEHTICELVDDILFPDM